MFADKIRVLRKEKKLTQAEVAKEVDCQPGAIRTWSWVPSPGMTRCSTSRTSTMCPWTG